MPVSWKKVGKNRFRLRWREPIPGPNGERVRGPDGRIRRRDRTRTVTGTRTRDLLIAEINLQLETKGCWTEPAPAPDEPAAARLDAMAAGWLRWKATRCAKGSMRAYILHARRFVECLERVAGVAPDSGTADLLRRDRFIEVVRALQAEGLSRSTVYSISRSGLELWRWASDDPETWHGVPAPPREAKAILPRPPRYTAPEATDPGGGGCVPPVPARRRGIHAAGRDPSPLHRSAGLAGSPAATRGPRPRPGAAPRAAWQERGGDRSIPSGPGLPSPRHRAATVARGACPRGAPLPESEPPVRRPARADPPRTVPRGMGVRDRVGRGAGTYVEAPQPPYRPARARLPLHVPDDAPVVRRGGRRDRRAGGAPW